MKLVFQIIFWFGVGAMSIGFLFFSILQNRRFYTMGFLKHLSTKLNSSEQKISNWGGIFLFFGVLFLAIAIIYHMKYGLN